MTEEYFSTSDSEARLDLIKHLIENSELVPLVRGMSGIGKSLLASRLQSEASSNWVVCHFSADSMMQPERLLAQIARCNGLPDAKDDNLRRLVDRFEMLRKRGAIPVLLVDDAQELPPTSLITLLRLYERQIEGAPIVSLVLFANEQIDMLLSTPQLQIMSPQSIQVIDLPALTREEADAYMGHLLRTEGLGPELALDAGRMDRLYRVSRGAPGPLGSAILDAVGAADGSREPATGWFRKLWFWVAVPVGVIVFLLLLFQGPINLMFAPKAPISANMPAKNIEMMAPETKTSRESPPGLQLPAKMPEVAEGSPQPPEQPLLPEAQVETTAAGSSPAPETGEVTEVTGGQRALPVRPGAESQSETVASSEPVSADTPRTPPVAVNTDEETEVASSAEQAVSAPEKSVSELSEKPVEKQVVEEQNPAGPSLVKSVEWLKQQAPGSYTIQLLAVENIESLQPVIEKYGLQSEAFSIRTQRKGRSWYPLLWGQFPNRGAATEALNKLAPELRKGGAWARPLSSLQP